MARTEQTVMLGNKLRDLRLRKEWTLDKAAAAIGVAKQTLVNWENGDKMMGDARFAQLAQIYDSKEYVLRKLADRPKPIISDDD